MKKNNLLLVAASGLFLASCGGGGGVKKTPGGIEYVVHKSGNGPQLKLEDTAMVQVIQKLNDSVLVETRKLVGGAVPLKVFKSKDKLDLMDGIVTLKVGDSATFTIPFDSIPAMQQQQMPFAKKGDKLKVTFVVEDVYSYAKQDEKDEKLIKEYLDNNKIKASKNAQGVYVAVKEEGTGEVPKAGDTVFVHYTGKLTTGKVFDSSQDSTMRPGMPLEPIKFPLGQGFVIKGWDAGLSNLKKGAKATLVIPSALAYGLPGSPPAIPGNAILVFDVQLVDFKAGKPAAPVTAAPAPAAPAAK